MFDLGFSELFLIGVIALLVLGPERLPKAARTVGALLRRARSSYMSLKSDIERELAADELKRSINSVTDPVRSVREAVSEVDQAGRDFQAELRRVDKRNADAEVESALAVPHPAQAENAAADVTDPARSEQQAPAAAEESGASGAASQSPNPAGAADGQSTDAAERATDGRDRQDGTGS